MPVITAKLIRSIVMVTAALGGAATIAGCNPADRTAARNPAEPTSNTASAAVNDTAITAKVKTALLADPDVKGLKIEVDTANGVVMLRGTVSNPGEREKALQIARGVSGVQNVNDSLSVN